MTLPRVTFHEGAIFPKGEIGGGKGGRRESAILLDPPIGEAVAGNSSRTWFSLVASIDHVRFLHPHLPLHPPYIPLASLSPSLSIFITTAAGVRSHPYRDLLPRRSPQRARPRARSRERPCASGPESRFQFDITDAAWRHEGYRAARRARSVRAPISHR